MSLPSAVPLFLVDAFAEGVCRGNPAAVCLLDAWPADDWLQRVASEMNQSETAFLVPHGQGFALRWLTPEIEVDLCGHATLASAFVLWHAGKVPAAEAILFSTRSGTLTARPVEGQIELDFPLTRTRECQPPHGLLEALGAEAAYVGHNGFDYLVEVATEDALRRLAPDFRRLAAVDCRGVIVTARGASAEFDFVSRFFAPAAGIDEDPVTGSAHCTLAPFWQERLGKTALVARQASRRGGIVRTKIDGERVLLLGQARLVLEGTLHAQSV